MQTFRTGNFITYTRCWIHLGMLHESRTYCNGKKKRSSLELSFERIQQRYRIEQQESNPSMLNHALHFTTQTQGLMYDRCSGSTMWMTGNSKVDFSLQPCHIPMPNKESLRAARPWVFQPCWCGILQYEQPDSTYRY